MMSLLMENLTTVTPIITPRQDCTLFNFITWGILGSISCLLGAVGNLLSFIAFQRDHRRAPTTLLQCLAVSDFILLITVFATDPLPYICDYTGTCSNFWVSWVYIRYVWLITPVSHMCSIWFVVLIALNRFWAVCRPHAMHRIWTMRHTVCYIVIVIALVVGFNSPRFFEYTVIAKEVTIESYNHEHNTTTMIVYREGRTSIGNNYYYRVVYKALLVNIILVLIPLIMLIALTLQIISVIRSKRRRGSQRLPQGPSRQEICSQNQNNNGQVTPPVQQNNYQQKPINANGRNEVAAQKQTLLEPTQENGAKSNKNIENGVPSAEQEQLIPAQQNNNHHINLAQTSSSHLTTTPMMVQLATPIHTPQHRGSIRSRLTSTNSVSTCHSGRSSSRRTNSSRPVTSASSRSEITFVLVLVVLVAIICNVPLCVALFARVNQDASCGTYTFYLDNVGKLLVNVMSCINFVIYCLFSTKFRRILRATLCCEPLSRQLLGPVASNRTASSFRFGAQWSFTISSARRR